MCEQQIQLYEVDYYFYAAKTLVIKVCNKETNEKMHGRNKRLGGI